MDPLALHCSHCDSRLIAREATCFMGACLEFYCAACGRYMAGVGPVGCFCGYGPGMISGGHGHGTKPEQPRKPAPWRVDYGRRRGRRMRRAPQRSGNRTQKRLHRIREFTLA